MEIFRIKTSPVAAAVPKFMAALEKVCNDVSRGKILDGSAHATIYGGQN
jgi:hypothetical protein